MQQFVSVLNFKQAGGHVREREVPMNNESMNYESRPINKTHKRALFC